MKVTLYTTSWCGFCQAEKRFLTTQGVPFRSIDIEADPEAGHEMLQLSGQMGVPFTVISRPGEPPVGILGFDQPRLARELGLIASAKPIKKTARISKPSS